jgi:hypothetical protein
MTQLLKGDKVRALWKSGRHLGLKDHYGATVLSVSKGKCALKYDGGVRSGGYGCEVRDIACIVVQQQQQHAARPGTALSIYDTRVPCYFPGAALDHDHATCQNLQRDHKALSAFYTYPQSFWDAPSFLLFICILHIPTGRAKKKHPRPQEQLFRARKTRT